MLVISGAVSAFSTFSMALFTWAKKSESFFRLCKSLEKRFLKSVFTQPLLFLQEVGKSLPWRRSRNFLPPEWRGPSRYPPSPLPLNHRKPPFFFKGFKERLFEKILNFLVINSCFHFVLPCTPNSICGCLYDRLLKNTCQGIRCWGSALNARDWVQPEAGSNIQDSKLKIVGYAGIWDSRFRVLGAGVYLINW